MSMCEGCVCGEGEVCARGRAFGCACVRACVRACVCPCVMTTSNTDFVRLLCVACASRAFAFCVCVQMFHCGMRFLLLPPSEKTQKYNSDFLQKRHHVA